MVSLPLARDLVSFVLALLGDGLGRKLVLALGTLLMAMSGVVLATSGNCWMLVAAAIFGVVSLQYGIMCFVDVGNRN